MRQLRFGGRHAMTLQEGAAWSKVPLTAGYGSRSNKARPKTHPAAHRGQNAHYEAP
jgi:hypothetical protein